MADREEMSLSFGSEASTYEAGRPSYPAEAGQKPQIVAYRLPAKR